MLYTAWLLLTDIILVLIIKISAWYPNLWVGFVSYWNLTKSSSSASIIVMYSSLASSEATWLACILSFWVLQIPTEREDQISLGFFLKLVQDRKTIIQDLKAFMSIIFKDQSEFLGELMQQSHIIIDYVL